jgi:nucleoside-diphosphate-sugar epimerase
MAAARGHEVVCLTRSARGWPGELALASPWTRANLHDTLMCVRPDVVVHCAGTTHSEDARACFETNTVLAAELLGAAATIADPPRIVLVGSAAEYGFVTPDEQPVCEMRACAPTTEYAVAKHAQTLLGVAAARRGLPVLVVRLFNPVGVGMPRRLALPSFARQLAGPEAKLTLRVGNLSVQRDLIDVEEAVRLLLGLAAMQGWPWSVVNVCSGRAYRLGDLLDGLIAASGAEVRVEVDPALMRPGDMPVLTGSTERLRSVGLVPLAPDFSVLLPRLLAEARGI